MVFQVSRNPRSGRHSWLADRGPLLVGLKEVRTLANISIKIHHADQIEVWFEPDWRRCHCRIETPRDTLNIIALGENPEEIVRTFLAQNLELFEQQSQHEPDRATLYTIGNGQTEPTDAGEVEQALREKHPYK